MPMKTAGCPLHAPFRNSLKATWINIWIASSEYWYDPEHLNGTRILFEGKKRAIDWDDMKQAKQLLTQIRHAGIDVVLFDLTNGFHDFIIERSKKVGSLCRELGMQFAFAAGNADDEGMEERAKITWENFSGSNAPFEKDYFSWEGKPLLILYVVREQYERLSKRRTGYLSRFYTGWASGEDPDKDKWGWQLTPSIGAVGSKNVMYITPSLRWDHTVPENWHKSLAFLDYNFLKAKEARPRMLVVGSFDDVCERNSWMPVDTTQAPACLQQKNIYGEPDETYYYQRVCDWLSERGPYTVPGGSLPDGAYRLTADEGGSIGVCGFEDENRAPLVLHEQQEDFKRLIWLYHLGEGQYRILRLCAGKSLEASEGRLLQAEPDTGPEQRWLLLPEADGCFIKNAASGQYLSAASGELLLSEALKTPWEIQPHLTIG